MRQSKGNKASKRILNLSCFILSGLLLFLFTNCSVAVFDKSVTHMLPDAERPQMKTYFMKQKIWTLADRFVIRDEYKNPMFYVKGKVFSFGDKLKFFDMDGNELVYIKQKVFSFNKQYKIYRNQQLFARVVKKITLFKDKFVIDIPGPDDYFVKGNFTDHRYTFIRNGRGVAFISKKWLSWGDTYRIEIVPGEDDVVILAAAVVIDMVSHGDEEHHHSHL